MPSGRSWPALWNYDINLNVSFCCRYQQQRSDTDKPGLPQDLRHKWMPTTLSSPAATGTLPCLQAIHMGVACPSAQRSYQRTGGGPGTHWLNLLLPQSAPTCASEWCGCTSSGDLECFFSVDPSQVLLQRGADGQMPPQVSAMGLVFFCRCVLLGELDALPISAWWLAWVLSVAGNCYLSRTSAICCTVPMVGETKISKSLRPYRPSNNTGWTP